MLYKKSINIWVVNKDGSGLTQLTDFDGYLNTATRADWSPDGSRIAFTKRVGDRHMIHVIDADGTNLTYIEPPVGFSEGSPTWSPDGTRIAFSRWDETIPHAPDAIFLMDVDGSNVQEVTPPSPMLANGYPEYTDSNPAWSPDGSLIAFDRLIELEDTYRIHLVRPDGTDLVDLTPNLDHRATDPSWSPDGTQIVFDGGNWGIYTMNADGSNVTIIDPTDTSAADPDWRP
jgi:TolB protein